MYDIKTVSKMLNISPVTLRAWENRYGAVSPARTPGGQRLYTDQDVEDLRWLIQQKDQYGVKISQAVRLLRNRRNESDKEPLPLGGEAQSIDDYRNRLYGALCAFDTEKANRIAEMGFALFDYEDFFYHILVPVMHQIGDEWEQGKVTVAQEHFASHFFSQRFLQFFRLFPIRSSIPKVLALCPSGEHHQLGLMLFSLFLRKKGVDVIYLGADTPMEGLDEAIRRHAVRFVAVSISDKSRLAKVQALIQGLKRNHPELAFVLGGQGFVDASDALDGTILGEGKDHWEAWFDSNMAQARV